MIKVSNSKLISIFTKLLIVLFVTKLISFGVWWFLLPSHGVELEIKENYQPKYQRVSFNTMIKAEQKKKKTQVKRVVGKNITDMTLKGLYGKGAKGFVIVTMKSTPKKTAIVEVGEIYEGYTLKSISASGAKFHKNGSDFMLKLEKVKTQKFVKNISQEKVSPIESGDNTTSVSRNDIRYYAKNPKQIWRDISIKEVRDGRKIKGFKVKRIKAGSRFATLGLKKGDLIIKANNIRLKSYKDALDIYRGIDKLDAVQIVVVRNNQEVELVYEIN